MPQNRPVISQEAIQLFDEYTHAPLPRREFMRRLTALAGSTAAATAMLPFLENNYARAEVVPVADPRIKGERISIPAAAGGKLNGYLVVPAAATGKLPTVILVHENRGLNPHIEDVARRLALAGFLVFAPDYLTAQGGTPTDEDKARDMFAKLDPKAALGSSLDALKYLQTHPQGNGKVGVVGFCWGGGQANQLAVNAPELAAAVAYYGAAPKTEEVAKIKAAVLLHFAGLDERINAGMQPYADALKAAGKIGEVYLYDGVNHAFNNDTNAARYDEKAAKLAWERTLAFLGKYLKA